MRNRRGRRIVAACLLIAPATVQAQTMIVTLLGTGGPEPAVDRFGPATLVQAGATKLVFDAGRGVSQRLWQLGVRPGEITRLFLTHLHSDHVMGLPDLWLTGFQATRFGGRTGPLEVWGPPGTSDLLTASRRAFDADVQQRSAGAAVPDEGVAMMPHEIQEGVIYERDSVRVTAFRVSHGAPAIPAFGYRIDYAGRSVVISGDTRYDDNLIRFARGADVIIHEVMIAAPAALQASDFARRVMSSHTSPEEAGRVFAQTGPRLAVFTHVGLLAQPARRQALLDSLVTRTRTMYNGPVEVGEDLMTISIGNRVEVRRLASRAP